jgi:hypothetical protein
VNELVSFSIQIAELTYSALTLQSGCISIAASHPCTTLVKGTGVGSSLGFFWDSANFGQPPFILQQRLGLCRMNPFYPIEGDDYKYSNGERRTHYAEREKISEWIFSEMGETEHDTLSAQILTDTFLIGTTEYHVEPKDYKPLWDGSNYTGLTEGRILAQKMGSIIRNK